MKVVEQFFYMVFLIFYYFIEWFLQNDILLEFFFLLEDLLVDCEGVNISLKYSDMYVIVFVCFDIVVVYILISRK